VKVFIPYADEPRGVNASLVPFDHNAMRIVRIETLGESSDAVCQVVIKMEQRHAQYHIASETRYGDTQGKGTTDL